LSIFYYIINKNILIIILFAARGGKMNGFTRRKEQKKESIRQAAIALFKTYGFNKVSINDIAHQAGVSQVTIYNHFGSKDELVHDIVKTVFLSYLEKYREIIKGDKTFPEKMEIIVFEKTELASQYHGEWMQTVARSYPQIQQFIENIWMQEINQLMIDFFAEGKKQGYVNPELSQEALMLYLEILRKGVFASSGLITRTGNSEKLMRDLISLSLYGLVGKKE